MTCLERQWIHGLRQSWSLCRIFLLFYAMENSDPEVVGLLSACPNHAEWRSVNSPSASSWFSHLEFGQYVMSPLSLAVLVRCFGVLFWRNALSDYGYMFCVSRFHGAVLGLVFDMSVGVQQQGFGQTVEKTVGSAVAPLIRGRCPRFAGRADSLVQVWRRQSYPTVAACPYVFLDKVVDMPSLCNGRCLVFGAETADSP